MVLSKFIAPSVTVSDKEVKAYYDENQKFFKQPERVAASHILITPDKNEKDKTKADAGAKKKTDDILAKIKSGKIDFAKAAETESACPSGKSAKGSLGEFGRGQMVKPFEDVAFGLKPNEMSGVVKTQFGYHIIKVTGKKDAATMPFAEVKGKIKERLNGEKFEKTLKAIIEKEKKTLNIKINV